MLRGVEAGRCQHPSDPGPHSSLPQFPRWRSPGSAAGSQRPPSKGTSFCPARTAPLRHQHWGHRETPGPSRCPQESSHPTSSTWAQAVRHPHPEEGWAWECLIRNGPHSGRHTHQHPRGGALWSCPAGNRGRKGATGRSQGSSPRSKAQVLRFHSGPALPLGRPEAPYCAGGPDVPLPGLAIHSLRYKLPPPEEAGCPRDGASRGAEVTAR